jgi:hypothetical protein
VKIFGRDIWYSPEETAEARMRAITSGASLRRTAKIHAYIVTTEYDRFEKYRITRSFFGVIKMHLALGLEYLFCRLKERRLSFNKFWHLALLLCAVCFWQFNRITKGGFLETKNPSVWRGQQILERGMTLPRTKGWCKYDTDFRIAQGRIGPP